ncbi:MAG: hypothetical protein IPM56_09140 [Ignavibacteriales bacterium]|nr:MAG: hypothetical protein IPM56_09140 [Ignavibacteriales bacterium]
MLSIKEYLKLSITKFSAREKRLTAQSKNLAVIRVVLFLISLVLFIYFVITDNVILYWSVLSLFIVSFGILTGIHNKIEKGILRNKLWQRLKELNLARLEIDWEKIPLHSQDQIQELHPFQKDLDISGQHSLIHLIDTTISEQGHALLTTWLTSYKNNLTDIHSRQRLVKELISETRYRDKLQLAFLSVAKKKLNGDVLIEKLNQNNSLPSIRKILKILLVIAPINIILFLSFLLFSVPAFFSITVLIYLAIHWFNLKYISSLFEKADSLMSELGRFSTVLEFVEVNPLNRCPEAKELCSVFYSKHSPAKLFKRINRIIYALSFQKNPLFELLLNALFPWDFYFSYRFEIIKDEVKESLPKWLDVWYKLEALNSLSNFGWLNPGYTFPKIISEEENPLEIFSVKSIGHPLIPVSQKVTNDFTVNSMGEVSIITGSNMSGKSTFLKTAGVNLALAYAGAPVNATGMSTKLFRIFSSLKVNDSVTDGVSFFYAEVKRLKYLLDELNIETDEPLFFLIDEIFRGTNNVERLIGSRSYVKAISGKNGVGLISTHDLELIKLENKNKLVRNFHFKEDAIDGKMVFDYKLRQGPCPTTNALKIMKLEGLPIE